MLWCLHCAEETLPANHQQDIVLIMGLLITPNNPLSGRLRCGAAIPGTGTAVQVPVGPVVASTAVGGELPSIIFRRLLWLQRPPKHVPRTSLTISWNEHGSH
jgi:hypothetical protein